MDVFVVSHHEGLVAVTATEPHADRIVASFVAQYRHTFGKPWVERVQVQTEESSEVPEIREAADALEALSVRMGYTHPSMCSWSADELRNLVGGLSVTTQEPQP